PSSNPSVSELLQVSSSRGFLESEELPSALELFMTRFVPQLQPLGLLLMRLALGIIMMAHGWPKLMNISKFASGPLAHIGAPAWMAYLVVTAEVIGGALLILGLLTPFAAI